MKTIPALSLLAALSAFVLFVPLSFEVVISVLFGAGLVGILAADYAHIVRVRPAPLQLAPVVLAIQRTERLRLAA